MGNQTSQQLQLRASSLMTKILLKSEQQVIQHLTEEQIQLNRPINQVGDRIAHYAAYKSMYRLLDWLINKDANFQTSSNHRNLTPIDIAVPQTREWIFKKLKDYQVIKNQKTAKTQKPKLTPKQSIKPIETNPFSTNPFEKKNPVDTPTSNPNTQPMKPQPLQNEKNNEKNSTNNNQIENKGEEQRKESIDFASFLFNNNNNKQ